MSDEKLIELVNTLQEEMGSPTFNTSDYILRDAAIAHLELRGFVVTEVLKIEHASRLISERQWGAKQDKEEDGKEESKQEGQKDTVQV